MATEKIMTYTPEQTKRMLEAYQGENRTEATVEALALEFGKTVRSVVAKLSREGVYVAKAKPAQKREMLKAEMVTEIAQILGKSEEQLESLEKATQPALKAVLEALRD